MECTCKQIPQGEFIGDRPTGMVCSRVSPPELTVVTKRDQIVAIKNLKGCQCMFKGLKTGTKLQLHI